MIRPITANIEKKVNEYDNEGVRTLETETIKENIKIRIFISSQNNPSDPRFVEKNYTGITKEAVTENMLIVTEDKKYEVMQSAKIANGYQLLMKEV